MLKLIAAGELEIAYAHDCTTPGNCVRLSTEAQVTPSLDTARPADRMFAGNFFGDRLDVSLGPIAFSHRRREPAGRDRFNGRRGTIDLSASAYKLTIEPGELLTIQTIERVRLGRGLAAVLLPRLTLATAGLQTLTSYVDPGWNGILQVALVNISDKPYELTVGERIAVLRFYEVSSPVSQEEVAKFAEKSHHYGLTWEGILDKGKDPMPFRKLPVERWDVRRIRASLQGAGRLVVGSFGLVAVLGALMWLGARNAELQDALSLRDEVEAAARINQGLVAELEAVEARAPVTASSRIGFDVGQADQSIRVTLRAAGPDRRHAAFVSTSDPDVRLTVTILSDVGGEVTVEIRGHRDLTTRAADIPVEVAVL